MARIRRNRGYEIVENEEEKWVRHCLPFLLGLFLVMAFFSDVTFADELTKKNGLSPDKIDRIMALLPVPSDFSSVRSLFFHYRLMVKDVMISHNSSEDSVTILIDFFLPLPPHCHPTRRERIQYYLQKAIWTKSAADEAFIAANQWARHIELNESDWLTGVPCYP